MSTDRPTDNSANEPPPTMIERIWVIVTTETVEGASQSGRLELKIGSQTFDLPDIPTHRDRAKGVSTQYDLALDPSIDLADLNNNDFVFIAKTRDAWLPKSVWAIGKIAGEDKRVLVADNPDWPEAGWIGTEPTYAGGNAKKKRNFNGAVVD